MQRVDLPCLISRSWDVAHTTKHAHKLKMCCSWWRAGHHSSAASESKALTAPWCRMRPCAKKVTCTLRSSALHVGRPLTMGLWMSHLCTGPAPPGKEAPGKDPPLAGQLTPATLKMQASIPRSLVLYSRRSWSLALFVLGCVHTRLQGCCLAT